MSFHPPPHPLPPVKPIEHVVLIELHSPAYFAACAIGGALACGITHTLVTPIDLVKCNAQANPVLFDKNTLTALRMIGNGDLESLGYGKGWRAIYRGWGPTLFGYSIQGAFKFGLYEYFKHYLAYHVDPLNAVRYRDAIYITSSACAELIADIFLCPFEAVKVRVQTNPKYAKGLRDGLPRMVSNEGFFSLWSGLIPLWCRQIPYTVMKFLCFERIAELLYSRITTPKAQLSTAQQLGVVFSAGYLAGVLCGAVSHPADVLVSKVYKAEIQGSLYQTCRAIIRGTATQPGIGWRGLWLGFLPRVFMIGSLTGLQWLIYGAFKTQIGLETPGAAIMLIEERIIIPPAEDK